jgi:ABC-type glutathione transport system ATPase component
MLEVDGVSRRYPRMERPAVTGVTFRLDRGRTLAIVGESGAGKSTLARMLVGLERPTTGAITLDGRTVWTRYGVVSPLQMVVQNPFGGLNPLHSIGWSVGEPLRKRRRAERRARVQEMLELVGVDPRRMDDRPRAFSGGQLQRIVLARALAADPRVLVCDEPTSALDVSVQAQILNLILRLQEELNFACILVTHDLGVVRVLAEDVLVLKDGEVVEQRLANDLFAAPAADYTRELLAAGRPAVSVDTPAAS